ncbi:U4/U6 small nuclear ribonucleoprotein PRP4 [Sarotherodon galilaeus]
MFRFFNPKTSQSGGAAVEMSPFYALQLALERVFARVHRQECKVHLDYLKLEETYISFSAHEYRFLQRGEQEAARFPPRALVCCFVCVCICVQGCL